jgi:hypothetical protein
MAAIGADPVPAGQELGEEADLGWRHGRGRTARRPVLSGGRIRVPIADQHEGATGAIVFVCGIKLSGHGAISWMRERLASHMARSGLDLTGL